MKILHFYPEENEMIAQYVVTLTGSMGLEADTEVACIATEAISRLNTQHYDILHLHGCWQNASWKVVRTALHHGTRLVVSPHGQLEPWVMNKRRWKEKLPKQLLYQRNIIRQAYAVSIQGRMEQECMEQLNWNPRLVIIRNCLITHSITPQRMATETFRLYRRVMDSNTLEVMQEETKSLLRELLKAGITGDCRWVCSPLPSLLSHEEWRRLLLYAHQSQVGDTVQRGLHILGLDAPDIDTGHSNPFMPDNYEASESIEHAIGLQYATENERLLATFRHLRKLTQKQQLSLVHLVELDHELRHHECEEELLTETLRERNLLQLARRIMTLLQNLTGLDEGFMPVPPLNDRQTRQIRKQIIHHLKI